MTVDALERTNAFGDSWLDYEIVDLFQTNKTCNYTEAVLVSQECITDATIVCDQV